MSIFIFVTGLLLLSSFQSSAQSDVVITEEMVFHMVEENIEQYRKGDVTIKVLDRDGKPVTGARVSVDQVSHDFLFGALLFDLTRDKMDPDRERIFKERFLELFNYGIVPFYWSGYEKEPGHPRWDRMQDALTWCVEHDITVKGHPLAWTHQAGMPEYILNMSLEDSEKLLEARIMENVLGFDRISIWDVVNEPVNTVTWEMAHEDKDATERYRSDIPLEEVADWVDKAYKAAHRADPEKQLVLNEFRQFADEEIRSRFYGFVEELISRGTPVDALGIQAHEPREEWFNPVDVWNTLNLYAEFGLPLQITEFSPQSRGAEITGGYRAGTWTTGTQAGFTEMMYRIWFGHPSVESINWWGFSDANGWLPGCGITDEDLNPKPVYEVLKKLIREEWMTHDLEVVSDKKGLATFRGFYGGYNVEVITRQGGQLSGTFHLEKGKEHVWTMAPE